MKVLLASLQVSRSGSKGHLHPALELAWELRRQGHEVCLVPLPCPFGEADRQQVEESGLRHLEPPPAQGLRAASELARLAADPETVHLAYQAFLLDPLEEQFGGLVRLLDQERPDLVLSDMLVYGLALAARRQGIPDLGYCAGLKLVAPERLLGSYRESAARLGPRRAEWLRAEALEAEFRHLELLSRHAQFVFATPLLFGDLLELPPRTHLVGPLPISTPRQGTVRDGAYAVLCLGSALDPADYPQLTQAAVEVTARRGLRLLVASRRLVGLGAHVEVEPYLDLPALMPGAVAVIHHGGANSFSEALALGARQILVPLVNDQPIQAELLERCGAGLSLAEPTVETLEAAFQVLSDEAHPLHERRRQMAREYSSANGARSAVEIMARL